MPTFETIRAALEGAGFLCRGGFHPEAEDGFPDGTATVMLAGNAGLDFWPAFKEGRKAERDPLDAWTRRTLDGIAEGFGARTVFPFDGPPFPPFQDWARRAEPVHPSPIGPLIHPDFGLWHAYRGALLFKEHLDLPAPEDWDTPCATCKARFCLMTCPVHAFRPGRYDLTSCTDHIGGPAGIDCMEKGCRARRACPIGLDYAYGPEQMRFHMERFLETYGHR